MIAFLNTFWQTGLLCGILMGLFHAIDHDWRESLSYGAFAGFAFGLAMAVMVHIQSEKFKKDRPLDAGEKLIYEGHARYRGKHGWIYLTDKRLFYVSGKLKCEFEFPLADIALLEKGRTLGIVPNKLVVNLKNGERQEFKVDSPKYWVNEMERTTKLFIEAPRNS